VRKETGLVVCVLGQTGTPRPEYIYFIRRNLVPLRAKSGLLFCGDSERDLEASGVCSSLQWRGARDTEKRNPVMYKRLIVLLGMFLGSHAPAAAQTPAPQFVLAREHVAPIITMLRTVSRPLPAASFRLYQDPGKRRSHFTHLFAGDYEPEQSMELLPPVEGVRTLFFTRSSLQLVQLWSGRLRLDGFTGTLHMQNVQLGPSASGGLQDFRPPRQSYPGGPRSVDLYGVSLSFHFGHNARTGRPPPVWRCLSRIVGSARN
jgi:hypothetical protein